MILVDLKREFAQLGDNYKTKDVDRLNKKLEPVDTNQVL